MLLYMLSLHDEKTSCTCFAGQGQHGLRSQRCGHEAVWGLGVMRRGMFSGLDSSVTCTCFQALKKLTWHVDMNSYEFIISRLGFET